MGKTRKKRQNWRVFLPLIILIALSGAFYIVKKFDLSYFWSDAATSDYIIKDTNYPIPSGTPQRVIFVSTSGSDSNSGTQSAPLRNVSTAISKVSSGGTVVVRAGIYRETLGGLSKAITIQAYPHEEVWFSGADVVTGWVQDGSVWRKDNWTTKFCTDGSCYVPGFVDPNYPNSWRPDLVIINGDLQKQVSSKTAVNPGEFYVDYSSNKLYVGTDPNGKTVEAATRGGAALSLSAQASGTKILGVGFRHYATNSRALGGAMISSSSVSGVLVENSTFLGSAATGLFLQGSNNVVRGNRFIKNGFAGFSGTGLSGLIMEDNFISFNNYENFAISGASATAAGSKFTRGTGGVVRRNTFSDNLGAGFWCDIECYDWKVYGNVFRRNTIGAWYEISGKAVFASNKFIENSSRGLSIAGPSVEVYNNTFVKNAMHLRVYEDVRTGVAQFYTTAGTNIFNNIFADGFQGSMYAVDVDGSSLNDPKSMVANMNYNLYYRPTSTIPQYVLRWRGTGINRSFDQVDNTLRSVTGEGSNSMNINGQSLGNIFSDLTNYNIKSGSVADNTGITLPLSIAQLLGVSQSPVDKGALILSLPSSSPSPIIKPSSSPSPNVTMSPSPKPGKGKGRWKHLLDIF